MRRYSGSHPGVAVRHLQLLAGRGAQGTKLRRSCRAAVVALALAELLKGSGILGWEEPWRLKLGSRLTMSKFQFILSSC